MKVTVFQDEFGVRLVNASVFMATTPISCNSLSLLNEAASFSDGVAMAGKHYVLRLVNIAVPKLVDHVLFKLVNEVVL